MLSLVAHAVGDKMIVGAHNTSLGEEEKARETEEAEARDLSFGI